jgi:HEAT repeat protein
MFPPVRGVLLSTVLSVGLAEIAPGPAAGRAEAAVHADKVARLIAQLESARDPDDREDAAEDLGDLGDPAALPALERAARCDRNKDVREEARDAIKAIYANDERVRKLLFDLRHPDHDRREDAACDLAKYGYPSLLPRLEHVARHDPCKDVRDEARWAVEKIRKRFAC